jgi:hypothetical protein
MELIDIYKKLERKIRIAAEKFWIDDIEVYRNTLRMNDLMMEYEFYPGDSNNKLSYVELKLYCPPELLSAKKIYRPDFSFFYFFAYSSPSLAYTKKTFEIAQVYKRLRNLLVKKPISDFYELFKEVLTKSEKENMVVILEAKFDKGEIEKVKYALDFFSEIFLIKEIQNSFNNFDFGNTP